MEINNKKKSFWNAINEKKTDIYFSFAFIIFQKVHEKKINIKK